MRAQCLALTLCLGCGTARVPADAGRPPIPPARYFFPEDTAWSVVPPYDTAVQYHRTLYAIVFDDSTSGARIRQVFDQYRATLVAGWVNTGAYGVRLPDPGPTWAAVDSLLRRLRGEPGVHLVFPLNFREPSKLHGPNPNDSTDRLDLLHGT
jgi:hypothetical protein